MDRGVTISLLGGVEAERDGAPLTLGGVKLRAVLALLALSAPHSVSDDRLIEALWGDDALTDPANALQAQVAKLRRILGRDVIGRQPTGYTLEVDLDDIDVHRFERLVVEGRAAAADADHQLASQRFCEAVGLTRGPPLGALQDHAFALEAASRLEQLALEAHGGHIDAELAAGRHTEVVTTLVTLVAEHPLWERFHGQLMTALYRCGRQSDALRAYANARAVLGEEVGLEPGPELQALERAILAHDPTIAAPVPLLSIGHLAVLPRPLTSFIGRASAVGAVIEAQRTARLATIVGTGGVGKTRLVIEAAHAMSLTAEVWFVDLSPVRGPAGVPGAFASAIGAGDHSPSSNSDPHNSPLTRAAQRIGARAVTVVVDNCEHVLEAIADLTARLLAACPALSIIATSREPLGVDGEHQLALGPMDDADAAALFAARASAVQPRLVIDAERSVEVVGLCRKLDGLPLAIELAAARTKTLPVPEITARLEDRFQLLVDPRRAPARYDGLRGAIDWSYDLLFEDEKRAFRWLAVFTGGATTEAAEAHCGPDALDLVARLVDKSLLVADVDGRSARFSMLETVRAYAMERLVEAGELGAALASHARWCCSLAEQASALVRSPEQVTWLDRLDREHENLCSALDHATVHDHDTALRLVGALVLPWWFRGRGAEARARTDACLAAADDGAVDPRALAGVLLWCGLLADFADGEGRRSLVTELQRAEVQQRRALAIALLRHDEDTAATARSQLALNLIRRNLAGLPADAVEVAQLTDAAIAAFTEQGDLFGLGFVYAIVAVGALADGDTEGAADASRRARAHAEASGDHYVAGRVDWFDGVIAEAGGDIDGAYRHIERGLRLLDELGMRREVTTQAVHLADLADRRGEHDLAEQWRTFVEGRSGGLARHDALMRASSHRAAARRAAREGDLATAQHEHGAALELYEASAAYAAIASTHARLAALADHHADRDGASGHLDAALDAAFAADDADTVADVLRTAAHLLVVADGERAATLLGAAHRQQPTPGLGTDDEPGARAEVEAATAHCVAALGEAAFADHFHRGTMLELTREAAVELLA